MNAMVSLRVWSLAGQLDQGAGVFGSALADPLLTSMLFPYDIETPVAPNEGPRPAADSGVNHASGAGKSALLTQTLTDGHYDFSGDKNVDAILIGAKWTSLSQTYSFPTASSNYAGYTTGENTNGFSAFNATQQTAVRYALGLVSQYTLMAFSEITETDTVHADHRFANTAPSSIPNGGAYGNFPSDYFAAGDAWFRTDQPFYGTPAPGNWGQATIMHEIGHTMGLKHGMGDYTAADLSGDLHVTGPRYGSRALDSNLDGQPYSLMTYRGAIGESSSTFEGDQFNQPQTYMQYDIAALQYMYGANYGASANNTSTIYSFSPTTGQMFINGVGQTAPTSNIVFRTVWDGGGANDTYDFSNGPNLYTTPMSIDLQPGGWIVFDTDATGGYLQRANNSPLTGTVDAPGNVANALLYNGNTASLIENVYAGTGADSITGNAADNLIYGFSGNDTIRGLTGTDTAWFEGGVGASAVTLLGADHYQVAGPDGTDQLYGIERAQFGLPAATNVAIDTLLPAASRLTIGTTITGTVASAGNKNWYATALVGGTTYWFSLEGSASGAGTLGDPVVELWSDDTTIAASNDDGGVGTNSFMSFTPSATRTYWIDARAFSTFTGTFTLNSQVADDFSSAPTNSGSLAVGATATGTIGAFGDADWFAVSLVANTTYWFELRGNPSGGGTLSDAELRVLSNDGASQAALDDDGGAGFDSFVVFTPTTSGTFYLDAHSHNNGTGTYLLTAAIADDRSDAPTAAGAITVGGTATGTISPAGDQDWFAVSLTGGTTYWFDLKGSLTGNGTLFDPELRLLGTDGTPQLATDDDSGIAGNSFIAYTPSSSGTYFLSAQGHASSTGTYLLAASVADDYGSSPANAGSIAVGGTASGTISPSGDTDWFAVSVTAGISYWFELKGSPSGDGTLNDAELRLYENDGLTPAGTDDDGGIGFNAFIAYTPAASGTVYLQAQSHSGGSGTYQITAAAADDFSDAPTNAGSIAVGGSSTGTISPSGDKDWFAVSLTGGTTYWFEMRATSSVNGTLNDPELHLRTSDGTFLAASDDDGGIGTDSFIAYTPIFNETVHLEGVSHSGGTGTYVVSAAAADDYAAAPGGAGTLAVGGSVIGNISALGDTDWFAITLDAGTTYWLNLLGAPSGNGTLIDPLLDIRNSDGALVAASDDDSGAGFNSFLSFTAPTSGIYYVQASDPDSTGTYALTSQVADDYANSPATAGTAAPYTYTDAAIDFAGDADWFATTLTAGTTYWISTAGMSNLLMLLYGSDGTAVLGADIGNGAGGGDFISYTPSDTDVYHVAVLDAGGGPGSYTIAVAGADDYADNPSTTGTISPGGSVPGTLDPVNGAYVDDDWFNTTLTAGTTYWFQLNGSSTSQGSLANPSLMLLGDHGATLVDSSTSGGIGNNAFLAYTPSVSGDYQLVAFAEGGGSGTYRLIESIADDFAAVPATLGTITEGTTNTDTIEAAGDADWFATTLTAGTQYWFTLAGTGSGGGTLADPYLRLLNATGTTVLSTNNDNGAGTDAFISYKPSSTGTYYLSAQGFAGSTGSYTLSQNVADDNRSVPSIVKLLKLNKTISAAIEQGGDKDWFRVALTAGKTYWINEEGSPTGAGSLSDPHLRLLGDDGTTLIDDNDDGGIGLNASIRFTPATSGNYYVEAGGFGEHTGSYLIKLAAADDFAANPSTTGTLSPGDNVKGIINKGSDADWFTTFLNAGTTYWFGAIASASANGTLADPLLRLYSNDGSTAAGVNNNAGVGTNAFLRYTPTVSDFYHVSVQGFGGTVGSYHVTEDLADDYVGNPATTQTLAVGDLLSGMIDRADDTDWFRVTLTGGVTYVFSQEGSPTGQGTLADPLLRLFGDDGATQLASDNNAGVGANALLTYTPATSGTYHISAQSVGGATGTYRIGLSLTSPDTAGAVATAMPAWDDLQAIATGDLLPPLIGPPAGSNSHPAGDMKLLAGTAMPPPELPPTPWLAAPDHPWGG